MNDGTRYLFLDFDGVICDSAEECWETSIRAYKDLRDGSAFRFSSEDKTLFLEYRPFIRNGEDYIILLEAIREGIPLEHQDDFDALHARFTEKKLTEFGKAFLDCRKGLFDEDREGWLDMNPLFPEVEETVRRCADAFRARILSTKPVDYIRMILEHWGVQWDEARITYTPGKRKTAYITDFLDARAGKDKGSAAFVEDQYANLRAGDDPRITGYLAEWGYIQEACRDNPEGLRVIGPDDFARLAADYC